MINAKWKVITTVMLLIFCLCVSYTIFFIRYSRNQLEELISLQTEGVHNVAATIQEQTSKQYRKRIESFINFHSQPSQGKLLQAFANRDREKLLQLSQPFFKLFKEENPYFSTFSWVLPDNTAFLLVHKPEKHGMNVRTIRPDIASANREHRQVDGFAASPIGMQYRIVNSVEFNNQHLGVLQFGLQDSFLADTLHEKLHIPVMLVIPNNTFAHIKYSKLPTLAAKDFTVQSKQINLFRESFTAIDWNLSKQQVQLQDRDYMLLKVFTLNNYAKDPQAYIFVAIDISNQHAAFQQQLILITVFGSVLMLLSFLILYFSYGSLVKQISGLQIVEQVNRVLEDKVAERTKALQESEHYLKSIFNAPSEAIFVHDSQTFAILDVNQAMMKMFGVSREEAMQFSIGEFSLNEYPFTQEQVAERMYLAIHEGPQVFEWLARKKSGELFWAEVSIVLTEFSDHSYVIAVVRDIDARKKMEDEILKAKKLESVGVLAGGIAHDFNNILSAILGNIELASLIIGKDHKAFPLLFDARKASSRATKLTQQLLTFAKGGHPVKETTSLPQLIKESADFVLRGSSVSCSYDFPEDLKLVNVDTGQISQVIQNLIINARHSMPKGGSIDIYCSNIETSAKDIHGLPAGQYVKIVVHDTGTGISANIIEKIFDPYFSTKREGSGLGLSICHSIIKKHKGQILAQSTPGKGSSFTLYLPVSEEKEHIEEKKRIPSGTSQAARIMVMDDDTMLRTIAASLLEHLGHSVVLVIDGNEAITRYTELQKSGNPIDIIIMDLTIPGGMGGKEAVQEILKINPQAQVIVASGYSNDPVMANCTEFGFAAAIAKPFNLEELDNTLKSILCPDRKLN